MSREFPKAPMTGAVEAAKLMLRSSAQSQIDRARQHEDYCRAAYLNEGPMRDAALQLADAYALVRQIFERLLAENKADL